MNSSPRNRSIGGRASASSGGRRAGCARRAAPIFLASLALLALVEPAGATAPTTVNGTAYIIAREITSVRRAGPVTIVTSVDTLVLTGTITGIAVEPDVLVIGPTGAFTFRGEITGWVTIAGRSGQVVAGAVGTGNAGEVLTADAHYHLLSGTGDLSRLHLELTSRQSGPVATYTGEYHFD
jgi:hypothetical protein